MVLEAQWEAKNFNVTLNLNNGNSAFPFLNAIWNEGGNSDKQCTVTYGASYSGLPTAAPTSPGYSFKNWKDVTSDPQHDFPDGNVSLNNQTVLIEQNSTFKAQWTPVDVTLKLNPNISEATPKTVQTATVKFGSFPTTLNSPGQPVIPTRENYMFGGYFDNKTGTNTGQVPSNAVQYYNNMGIGTKQISFTGSKNLYAKWQPESYLVTLHFNLNERTWLGISLYPSKIGWNNNTGKWRGDASNKTITVTYSNKYPKFDSSIGSLPPDTGGYAFNGWYRGTNNTNGVYLPSGRSASAGPASGDTIFDLNSTS